MLSVPPLVLAAGLLLWGMVSGFEIVAVILALAVETGRWTALRFDLKTRDFERIADLCSVALALALAYALFGTRNFSEGLVATMLWLPMLFAPLVIAQRLSVAGVVPLSALLWSLRRQRAREPALALGPDLARNATDSGVGTIDFAYLCACLIAASAANVRTLWFFGALCAFVLIALWPQRRRGVGRTVWPTLAALGLILGFCIQLGLSRLQAALEDAALEWLDARWQGQADPYRARTAIGDIGSLKISDRIVLRVEAPAQTAVPLLRHASYNRYVSSTWSAPAQPFRTLNSNGDTWALTPGGATHHLRVAGWMTAHRALLALPQATLRLERLDVVSAQVNGMGAVRVEDGPEPLVYEAWYDPHSSGDSPPGTEDLVVPPALAPVLREISLGLGLPRREPADTVNALHGFFDSQFAYSLDLESSDGGARSLTRFLREDRRGHCEYFATATVLLLRAARIPARYATGYAVQEWSPLEKRYLVRARHAHAWALAWVGDRWREVDTTPPVWAQEEAQRASALQPLYDLASALNYAIARWRAGDAERGDTPVIWTWLVAPLAVYLLWRAWRRRARRLSRARQPDAQTSGQLRPLLLALARLGHVRPDGAPLLAWTRSLPLADSDASALLDEIVRSYYRLRFDPGAASPAAVRALEAKSAALLARVDTITCNEHLSAARAQSVRAR